VIVVDPDQVVGPDQRRHHVREGAVDPQVPGIVRARELGQADAVVHVGPERPVGEAAIVFVPVDRREVEERIPDPVLVDEARRRRRMRRDLAAPADPEAVMGLERLLEGDREASGGALAGRIRHGHAVRDHDETRQPMSPG
jgi:hypothetical protein